MAGKKRAERKYRVIEVPCRPGTAPGRERFRGTRRDAEGYYEHLCESEPQGLYALVLVDGFGQPVYAAS